MKNALPVVAAAAIITLTVPVSAFAAGDYEMNRTFSQDVNVMLRDVNDARVAIRADKLADAKRDLTHAMQIHDRTATRARATHSAMLVPVYGELVQGSVLAATAAATPVPGTSPMPMVSAPATSASPMAMKSAVQKNYTVRRNSAKFTYFAVDLDKSGVRIAAAQKALAQGNLQAAADTLASIGDDLVIESTRTDLPLLTARENLEIAHQALAKHDDAHAKAAISAASAALKRYAESPGIHASDARTLSKQLASFENHAQRNRVGSENALADWWTRVKSWFSQHA